MTKWDQRGLDLAQHIASWSKDPSTKVGAVVMDHKHRVLGVGYNGFPRRIEDDSRLHNKEEKYPRVVHAEVNAILNSAKGGVSLYCTHFPCADCAGFIIQAGITTVISVSVNLPAWGESQEIAHQMFTEAGVYTATYDPKQGGLPWK